MYSHYISMRRINKHLNIHSISPTGNMPLLGGGLLDVNLEDLPYKRDSFAR